MKKNSKRIVYSSVVAAIYVALCLVFQPISYGPLQVRIAEGFVLLPFLDPIFIPGIFVGVMLANVFGGMGIWDILFGSLISLLAAYFTWKMPKKILAPVPPIVLNAFGVSAYLAPLANIPYWPTVLWIGLGEAIATYLIGLPILNIISKNYKK